MNNIAPLTPEDCDLRDFAFMPLDVARLRDSDLAATESPEACWTAVLLWAASWHQVPAASLPNDDRVLSNLAGYGRVVKEWHRVKEGALRGWIECSDGRLYHPVVAEKANESWHEKLKYAHGKLCGRLRKKGISSDDLPSFEQWTSDGMPEDSFYLPSVIPTERANNSTGNGENSTGIPPENTLKGQGQGQGQGLINNIVADSCESADVSENEITPTAKTTSRFDEFWAAYPTKVGKKPAHDTWKRKRLDDMADALIADVQLRAGSDRKWLGGYIPNPQTYLNQERWNDEIDRKPEKSNAADRHESLKASNAAAIAEARRRIMGEERPVLEVVS